MQPKVKLVIKNLSVKYNLPVSVIIEIVATPWRMTAAEFAKYENITVIEKKELPMILHPLFGMFKFSAKKIKRKKENGISRKKYNDTESN